jgi:hypothetical protein
MCEIVSNNWGKEDSSGDQEFSMGIPYSPFFHCNYDWKKFAVRLT